MIGNSSRTQQLTWWGFGVGLVAVLAWAVYSYVSAIAVAIFVYYAVRPIFVRVSHWIPTRTLAVITSLSVFILPVVALIGYTLNIAIQELYRVVRVHDISQLEQTVEPYVASDLLLYDWRLLLTSPTEFIAVTDNLELATTVLTYVTTSATVVSTIALNVLLVLVISFYLLRDDYRISGWVQTHFGRYLPQWEVYAREVDHDLSAIYFGNILYGVLTAILATGVYLALAWVSPAELSLTYPALIGLLCGVASLIPIIGTKLVYMPVGSYLSVQALTTDATTVFWFPVLFFIISYLLIDTIPDIVLRPYVSSKRLHTGLVLLAYVLGTALFGWHGIVLGPMLLVVSLHFANFIIPALLTKTEHRPVPRQGS